MLMPEMGHSRPARKMCDAFNPAPNAGRQKSTADRSAGNARAWCRRMTYAKPLCTENRQVIESQRNDAMGQFQTNCIAAKWLVFRSPGRPVSGAFPES